MKNFLRWLFLLPVAIVALLFALANRHVVTVSFDPFVANDIQGPQVTAPLFIIVILAVMSGALLGGFVVWLRQGRYRKAARTAVTETERLRSETEGLRARLAVSPTAALPARLDLP